MSVKITLVIQEKELRVKKTIHNLLKARSNLIFNKNIKYYSCD